MTLRPAWSTRASSRTGSKATQRETLSQKAKKEKNYKVSWQHLAFLYHLVLETMSDNNDNLESWDPEFRSSE